jgi:hypothetical protein
LHSKNDQERYGLVDETMIDSHNQSDDFMSDLLTDLAEMPVIGKVTQTSSSLGNEFVDDPIETKFEETSESIISSQYQAKQSQDIEQNDDTKKQKKFNYELYKFKKKVNVDYIAPTNPELKDIMMKWMLAVEKNIIDLQNKKKPIFAEYSSRKAKYDSILAKILKKTDKIDLAIAKEKDRLVDIKTKIGELNTSIR